MVDVVNEVDQANEVGIEGRGDMVDEVYRVEDIDEVEAGAEANKIDAGTEVKAKLMRLINIDDF